MTGQFKVGDHMTWNSEVGYVSGRLVNWTGLSVSA
jgi:hypothetical protein